MSSTFSAFATPSNNQASLISGSNITLNYGQFLRSPLWYTRVVLLILIPVLILAGNILVLVATWIEKILHQPNRYFIACLAVADLVVGIFMCPLNLYAQLNFTGIGSIHVCRFFVWIDILGATASIGTLTLISFDRYIKISEPLLYKARMTTSKCLFAICVIWFISALFATVGLFPLSAKSAGVTATRCVNDNDVYYVIAAGCAFFLPTVITMVMYFRIFFVAHKRRRMAQKGYFGQNIQHGIQWNSFYSDLKNIRMLAVIMGAFMICWGPFFTLKVVEYWHPGIYIRGLPFLIIYFLPTMNSVCNPIIYAWLDSKYRDALKRLYRQIKCQ